MGLALLLCACDPAATPVEKDHGSDTGETGHDTIDDTAADTGRDTAPVDTGNPVDADGDGALAREDCDDLDPSRHPGATDWCDGVDQDCDGDPVGDGMCGTWTDVDDLDTLYWTGGEPGEGFSAGWWGSLDGEPALQLLVTIEKNTARGVLVGAPPPDHEWRDSAVVVWTSHDATAFLRNTVPAGDFDGDGHDDAWVETFDYDGDDGRSDWRLQLGPSSGWSRDGIPADSVDDGLWYETWGQPHVVDSYGVPGVDVDGDGLADSVHADSDRGVTVIFGRGDPGGNHDILAEPWAVADGVSDARPAADIDADGFREILLRPPGDNSSLSWIPGADARSLSGQELDTLTSSLPSRESRLWPQLRAPNDVGDLDGDGVGDVSVTIVDDDWTSDDDDPPCHAWLSGALVSTAPTVEDALLATACWYGDDDADERTPYPGYADVDGDGVIDPRFFVQDSSRADGLGMARASVFCTFGTTQLELGGVNDASARSPCYSQATPVPDLTGDGLADYIAYNYTWLDADTDDYGRVDILPGFEVPYDDPSKW